LQNVPDAGSRADIPEFALPLDNKSDMQMPHSWHSPPEPPHRVAQTEGSVEVRTSSFPHQAFHAVVAPCPGGPERTTIALEVDGAADAFECNAVRAQS
jgi:hypothetical protein